MSPSLSSLAIQQTLAVCRYSFASGARILRTWNSTDKSICQVEESFLLALSDKSLQEFGVGVEFSNILEPNRTQEIARHAGGEHGTWVPKHYILKNHPMLLGG
ncbi:hypothetical protein BDQ12DRAFT_663277 [Crucibulum laeve]|uniref:Uncharacterized protein n=1 Tax=Crucibulum laeve TaxID=68775 RepID=A0A5C3M981_9AGAR|nr:hypothetical protein BDQ12DRAFT_663277 [Crucibulum laeve]